VARSVQEKDIAWHAGNWKYNKTSIGIEHGGYIDDPRWFIDSMYRSSAKLAAYLCRKYGMPVDRHNEVPDLYYVRLYG
jgi:N-acetyl-anhydromuramyl-L-alanine amidase AmpD